ncbi:hypothetical protein V5O48_013977, partial [Marasmius crinis-equi]
MSNLAQLSDSSDSQDFIAYLRHHSGSIILKIVYGYTLQEKEDPYLPLVLNAMEGVIPASNHGTFWVDYFPVLKYLPAWFPGASFKRKAAKWREAQRELKERPWVWMMQAQSSENNTAIGPSFCTLSAEHLGVTLGDNSETEDMIKNCAANAYVGGGDTTVSSILTFILAMSLHPSIQARAQAEIDNLGSGRLPDFSDCGSGKLPFVDAVIKETLRWNPVTPLGKSLSEFKKVIGGDGDACTGYLAASHRTVQDDIYEGYFIPAGATIVPNTWAILHDETLYGPNPMEFDPDRFLLRPEDGDGCPNPELYAFGFGRR